MAAKDVGAVAYFGDHRIVDVLGLVTNDVAEASNNGIGALYEALRHLPPRERPDYFAIYDTPPGPPFEDLRSAGVLAGSPLKTFDVASPEAVNGPLVVSFKRLQIYRADWGLVDTGDQITVRGDVRDYLNVGYLESERAHSYDPQLAQIGMQPTSVVRRVVSRDGRPVIDSGRRIIGGERFIARNLQPGRALTITARTAAPDVDLLVVANGVSVGVWDRGNDGTAWQESCFTIPGDLVTASAIELEVAPPRKLLSPYPDYTAFGYWFSQP